MEILFTILGVLSALVITGPILLPIILKWLAERNIFFTLVNEGEWKAVIRAGAFHHGIMAYKGFTEDENGNIKEVKKGDIKEDGNGDIKDISQSSQSHGHKGHNQNLFFKIASTLGDIIANTLGNIKDIFRSFFKTLFKIANNLFRRNLGGIRWLGIPYVNQIYKYNFRWVVTRGIEVSKDKPEDGFVNQVKLPNGQWAVSFSKQLDYIYLRDASYLAVLEDAETKESFMPVSIYAVVTLRVLNPYKALFRVDKWLDVTLFAIESALRSWTARHTYEEIIQKKEVLEHQADTDFLLSLTEKGLPLTEYIQSRYGIQIKRIQFLEVELPEEFRKQATAQSAAKREAERIATLRDAEYERFKKIAQAVEEKGEVGQMVFAGETIKDASKGQATTIFAPFGALQDLLKGMIGKKGEK